MFSLFLALYRRKGKRKKRKRRKKGGIMGRDTWEKGGRRVERKGRDENSLFQRCLLAFKKPWPF